MFALHLAGSTVLAKYNCQMCYLCLHACGLQAAHNHHRPGGQHHVVSAKHVPTVHCHSEAPRPLSKLGPATHAAHQQPAAVPLHTEPLLLQAQQAYRGGHLCLLLKLAWFLSLSVAVARLGLKQFWMHGCR